MSFVRSLVMGAPRSFPIIYARLCVKAGELEIVRLIKRHLEGLGNSFYKRPVTNLSTRLWREGGTLRRLPERFARVLRERGINGMDSSMWQYIHIYIYIYLYIFIYIYSFYPSSRRRVNTVKRSRDDARDTSGERINFTLRERSRLLEIGRCSPSLAPWRTRRRKQGELSASGEKTHWLFERIETMYLDTYIYIYTYI